MTGLPNLREIIATMERERDRISAQLQALTDAVVALHKAFGVDPGPPSDRLIPRPQHAPEGADTKPRRRGRPGRSARISRTAQAEPVCVKCLQRKQESEFFRWGGKPREHCKACTFDKNALRVTERRTTKSESSYAAAPAEVESGARQRGEDPVSSPTPIPPLRTHGADLERVKSKPMKCPKCGEFGPITRAKRADLAKDFWTCAGRLACQLRIAHYRISVSREQDAA